MQTTESNNERSGGLRQSPSSPEPDLPPARSEPAHSQSETLLQSLYTRLFDWPALSFMARAERATERYEEQLRRHFGPDIPHRKLLAFKFVYAVALLFPETWEDIYAAGKAGCHEEQRVRAAGAGR